LRGGRHAACVLLLKFLKVIAKPVNIVAKLGADFRTDPANLIH
jgi:hypothetical protein